MATSQVTPPQTFGTTTLGACALCNRSTAGGSGWMLGGAIAFGVGVTVALVSYYREGMAGISGMACALTLAVGGVLLVTGLLRGVKTSTKSFALGKVVVPKKKWFGAGETVEVEVVVMPEHTLHLLEARLELQAVETVDDAESILRSKELKLTLPAHLRERAVVKVPVLLPRDWPVDMESPEGATPRRTVGTRLRAVIDTEAHPVLQFEAPLWVSAER